MTNLLKGLVKILVGAILFCPLPYVTQIFAGNPPDVNYSSVTATLSGSNEVPADGHTAAQLTVTLKDNSGNPLGGDSVKLSTPSDGSAVVSPSSALLDQSGSASFTVTSVTSGTDSITVN